MDEIDEIADPKPHRPRRTGKSPVTTGKNRSQTRPTAGSRSVKGRFLRGNKAAANHRVTRPDVVEW